MRSVKFKLFIVCIVAGSLVGLAASPAAAATVISQSANTDITLGLPFNSLEFENPLIGTEMIQGYSILEWRDADYAPGPPRWYDDWSVSNPAGIDGNVDQIWMRSAGQIVRTVTTVASTVVSIHLVGNGNDGLAQVYVDGDPIARLDMHTALAAQTALIIVKHLPNTPHVVEVRALGPSPVGGQDDVATLGAAALAKTKWVQPPMPTDADNLYLGWNEISDFNGQQIVADDWRCDTNDPVTDIHWWGSFQGWDYVHPPQLSQMPTSYHITIWTDVPDPNPGDPDTFSHPGQVVWEIDCDNFTMTFVGWDYDPRTKCYETCYKFDQILEDFEYFYQEPNQAGTEPRIYWISIAANYEGVIPENPWGWKARPHFYNDDAVQIAVPTNPHIGDQYIDGRPIYWPDPSKSWDMAFELTATPIIEGVKWAQLPVPAPDGGPCYFGWDELSHYGGQQIVADDWSCQTTEPVTDIHWWGSYLRYTGTEPPPIAPDSFHIAVWTDTPPAPPDYFSHPRKLIKEWRVPRSDLAETLVGCDEHPKFPGLRDSCFYYEFDIPETEWFYQDPNDGRTIYWLSISAIYTQLPDNPWGWKTRERDPDSLAPDDAVVIYNPTDPVFGSEYFSGEAIYWQTTSYDTAFVLTTKRLGQTYVKWSQPPVRYTPNAYNGWNERSFYRGTQIAADDWYCMSEEPVTDIHWWGSYLGWSCEDKPPEVPESFHIAIWTDEPASGTTPWSHPGTVIWETDCNSFTSKFVGVDIDPRNPLALPEACFKFEQDIPEDEWFYQEGRGNIYWLSIAAKYPSGTNVRYPFGWKTVPHDPQSIAPDDAVVIWEPTAPTVSDVFIDGLPIYWPDPNYSWDLAFVLTTQEEPPKEPVKHLKWSQPPLEIDPNNEIPVYCGWDEPSYLADLAGAPLMRVVADDYRCLGTMPVTSLHWWGSYVGWLGSEPPLPEVDSWLIGFWSNVPESTANDFSYPEELLKYVRVPADRVEVEMVGWDEFPLDPDLFPETCFQYYVELHDDDDTKEIFWQNDFIDKTKDNVFWVSIVAVYPSPTPPIDHVWGWKTRPWHWMDDAVTFNLDTVPLEGDTLDPALITPIEYLNESYDVAFELDTDPNWIKWEQPFTGIRRWPHYEDVNSWAVELPPETIFKYADQIPDLQEGFDVDATDDGTAASTQILADDFPCKTTGLIRDIHIWGSWYNDEPPGGDANQVEFTLSIHDNIPEDTNVPGSYSMPGAHRWSQPFLPGQFTVERIPSAPQGYFNPCTDAWVVPNHYWAWKYNFDIDPSEAFRQEGSEDNPIIYWLNVQARPLGAAADTRFGWKTTYPHLQWQDFAVWAVGRDPFPGPWRPVQLPTGERFDLAFEITTKSEPVVDIKSLVADDWECRRQTPVTAAVWWGSYVGYRYQPCQTAAIVRPRKPDYFLLTIWDDIPKDPNIATSISHPNDVIWKYKVDQNDYDEVLVGFDKHPHAHDRPPREPVFRYSVRLPQDRWFRQKDVNDIYWFSVVAVFKDQEPRFPWGWTNHKHEFNDDAVTGTFDSAAGAWSWTELYDQMDESEDMSFVLFTEPGCFPCAHPDYDEWLLVGKPDCWCYPRQCHGDVDNIAEGKGGFWVYSQDLITLLLGWGKPLGALTGNDICADIDHAAEGKGVFRVYSQDLITLLLNWGSAATPPDCP
ncbi:MAG: DUF7901 domain-containing protein [Planctomycetota bacterium]